MKSLLLIVLAFLAGLYIGEMKSPSPTPLPATSEHEEQLVENAEVVEYEWYPVVKVVDGDTLTIAMDGKNATLRLIGLDTPETVDPRTTVQCFGKEASNKAKQILSGSSVRIETDPSQGELDKYGRTLAYVFLRDGINFNKYMIAEGYGHEYTYNLPYKYQAEFKEAERKAREEKKGLWADNACATESTASSRPDLDDSGAQTITPSGTYECSKNTYNCSDFTAQAEAQAVFNSCGGSANDIHKLDADGDGEVCESLP
ncbi:hypothetical protein A2853_03850 [Candidatus Kaiserbacteria bacterium RIFCSPHIGHO2_01_FULL_55_17]|uniref:TNase-like domain-containing protein n=1 Tax=Candidatus Kaiserbacteria bacterium RIFCSPHIGHO2_01_FULL_55_17 TaxID=1798484 RepID=A0A1F6D7V3_9BACT|nr:MAG: hypothetical protein A2853_03850 [Candidatus Kaiserbacteria bacterium RIFCSPHIGHO2_01_FULL_55_17]